jgi:hypothetical protein
VRQAVGERAQHPFPDALALRGRQDVQLRELERLRQPVVGVLAHRPPDQVVPPLARQAGVAVTEPEHRAAAVERCPAPEARQLGVLEHVGASLAPADGGVTHGVDVDPHRVGQPVADPVRGQVDDHDRGRGQPGHSVHDSAH